MASRYPTYSDTLEVSPTVAVAGFTPDMAALNAAVNAELSGVVRVSTSVVYGTGTLLSTGRHILTAAHVVDDAVLSQTRVYFQAHGGMTFIPVSRIAIHPGWTSEDSVIEDDVAVLELATEAPASVARYDLYLSADEVGQHFTLAGYGAATGDVEDTGLPMLRTGENSFDSDAAAFNEVFDSALSGSRQLIFDYDDGTAAHDASGTYLGVTNLGLGRSEAMLTPGDSGGPTFLRNGGALAVAGVNSYTTRPFNSRTDIDTESNSSFGEFAAVMRVSAYRPWIDSITRIERVVMGQTGTHPDRNTVLKSVAEGQLTAFLVEIGAPQQAQARVHYATRDGTAKAGEDYYAAQGDIVFDAGQTWCWVYVETVRDTAVEGAEAFSLVLTNPQNAHFPSNASELVATRTISDDSPATLIGVSTFAESLN